MNTPHYFDHCPRCGAETVYRDKGGLSLECSKCNWVAVEVEWVAAAVKNSSPPELALSGFTEEEVEEIVRNHISRQSG